MVICGVHFISGSKGRAKELATLEDYFLHFFYDEILDILVQHTNKEISRQAEK